MLLSFMEHGRIEGIQVENSDGRDLRPDGARVEIRWGWETPEDQRQVEGLLRAEGLQVTARSVPAMGNGVGIYVVLVLLGVPLKVFLQGYLEAAGADAWKGSKRLVLRLQEWFKTRYSQEPPHDLCIVALEHRETGASIELRSDLPDEAFRKALELEFSRGASYAWDFDDRLWRRGSRTETTLGGLRGWLRSAFRRSP